MANVGFEPTPFQTSALNWRLRPLGQLTTITDTTLALTHTSTCTNTNTVPPAHTTYHLHMQSNTLKIRLRRVVNSYDPPEARTPHLRRYSTGTRAQHSNMVRDTQLACRTYTATRTLVQTLTEGDSTSTSRGKARARNSALAQLKAPPRREPAASTDNERHSAYAGCCWCLQC